MALPTGGNSTAVDAAGGRELLHEAESLVFGERVANYGHPAADFTCTAAIWTALLKRFDLDFTFEPRHVGLMMIALKLSREMVNHKYDNLVDIAGYAAAAARTIYEKGEEE